MKQGGLDVDVLQCANTMIQFRGLCVWSLILGESRMRKRQTNENVAMKKELYSVTLSFL